MSHRMTAKLMLCGALVVLGVDGREATGEEQPVALPER